MKLLQIILNQNCESCLEKSNAIYDTGKDYILPIVLGGLAAWIAYRIFVSETRTEREKEEKRKEEERHNKLFYFAALIESAISLSKQQSLYIGQFIEKSKSDLSVFNLITWVSVNDIKRLNSQLNLEDYMLSYVNHFNSDKKVLVVQFKSIMGSIDFLDTAFEQIPISLKVNSDFIRDKQIEFQKVFSESYRIVSSLLINYQRFNPKEADELWKVIDNFTKAHTGSETDMKYFHDNFLVPVYEFSGKRMAPEMQILPEIQSLVSLTLNGQQIYKQILLQNNGIVDSLISDRKNIESVIKVLEISTEPLLKDYHVRK